MQNHNEKTCEDRSYRCCEAYPYAGLLSDAAEYARWYQAHLEQYAKQMEVQPCA